jgi:hypothetical protein
MQARCAVQAIISLKPVEVVDPASMPGELIGAGIAIEDKTAGRRRCDARNGDRGRGAYEVSYRR